VSNDIVKAYPSEYETEVVLKNGSSILVRPIRADDIEGWVAFISRLSSRTKYLRFHHVTKDMGLEEAKLFCTVDYKNTFAFVAEVLKEEHKDIVAIGRYSRAPAGYKAEIAFAIQDDYQDKGIGTKLMECMVNAARDSGITIFEGDVLSENKDMMSVLRGYGFHVVTELDEGVYHFTFTTTRTKTVAKKEDERERVSSIASVHSFLFPRSVAVIGAARHQDKIGHIIFKCILQNGFSGTAYPVNTNADSVLSVKAYPSILDIPGNVDLAVIAVPAELVPVIAGQCGHKGVRTLVVISDGFKETGIEGASREKALTDITFGYGMRLVGPNCMGIINTDPEVALNATFSQTYPPRGNAAFLSQSGAIGMVVLEYAKDLNIGISSFVSLGNRADISINDLLQYWEQDPSTKVILLYLESFSNPRKFSRIARRVSDKKPIIAVKGGSTRSGSRAASFHTGALATSNIASDALFRQAGIIRTDSIEDLFNVATLLSNQPLPKGRRVAIVTNGGGPGIIAADACEKQGLLVQELTQETINKLKTYVKRDIRFNNPLDMTAGATAEEFANVLKVFAGNDSIDAAIAIFIPPITVKTQSMEDAVRLVAPLFRRQNKPLLTSFMGQRGFKINLGSTGNFVPSYPFPEDAVSALAKACEYAEHRSKPKGTIPKIHGIYRKRARNIIETAMTKSINRPFSLSATELIDLLSCYNIRLTETLVAKTADEAVAAASKLGFPVAVKLASSTILHKTDIDAVKLDIRSISEVRKAFKNIASRVKKIGRKDEMDGVTVQRMVKGGIETIVGVTQDPSFGPLIMFGMGGIYAEMLKDVAVKLHPLTDVDAGELIGSIKMAKLFDGFRGSPPSDVQALEDLLLRLSALVEDMPEITELDFNPVKVMPLGEGYWIVDARIMVR
jgi:acetyltransferase